MKFNLFQIDAFTDKTFGGNPACVVPLENWLKDDLLLKIAKENAVAETAFFVDKGDKIQHAGLPQILKWIYADMPLLRLYIV
jgi:PhzF family phenazine biosynthesis protein